MNARAIMPARPMDAAVVTAGTVVASGPMPAALPRTRERFRREDYGRDQRRGHAEFANKHYCSSSLLV